MAGASSGSGKCRKRPKQLIDGDSDEGEGSEEEEEGVQKGGRKRSDAARNKASREKARREKINDRCVSRVPLHIRVRCGMQRCGASRAPRVSRARRALCCSSRPGRGPGASPALGAARPGITRHGPVVPLLTAPRRAAAPGRFVELAQLVEPGKEPKTDKLTILSEAIRTVRQLQVENHQLKQLNKFLEVRPAAAWRAWGPRLPAWQEKAARRMAGPIVCMLPCRAPHAPLHVPGRSRPCGPRGSAGRSHACAPSPRLAHPHRRRLAAWSASAPRPCSSRCRAA